MCSAGSFGEIALFRDGRRARDTLKFLAEWSMRWMPVRAPYSSEEGRMTTCRKPIGRNEGARLRGSGHRCSSGAGADGS